MTDMKTVITLLAAASVAACATTGSGTWKAAVIQDRIDTDKQHVFAMNSNRVDWPYADVKYASFGCTSDVGFGFSIATHNFLDNEGTTEYEVRVDGHSPVRGRGMSLDESVRISGTKAEQIARQIASAPQGSLIHMRVYAWDGEISSDSLPAYDQDGSVSLTMQRCGV